MLHHSPFTTLIATLALTLAAGCQSTSAPTPERIAGAAQAVVRGTVVGLDTPSASTKVALVWTYWSPDDCETATDAEGNVSQACSGSTLATTATLESGTNGFVITLSEPPPAFVHGLDTEVAEAVIALLPDGDITDYDMRSGLPPMRGVSRDHMVVYVPSDLPADRIEAQEIGGAPLGAGFHLVRALATGPQVEGTVGSMGCPAGDVCTAITSQRGEVVVGEEDVVIEVGDDEMPALFL